MRGKSRASLELIASCRDLLEEIQPASVRAVGYALFARRLIRHARKDRWDDQQQLVEVWSEKSTIGGTIRPVLDELGVTFRVMHGFGSATAICSAAQDGIKRARTVLYVGDFDPSGLYMSEVDLAMPPPVLRSRVEEAIWSFIEPEAWERAEVAERAQKTSMQNFLAKWPGGKSLESRGA